MNRFTNVGLIVMSLLLCRAATAELVDNPQYTSWAKHKPGTNVVFDMAAKGPGGTVDLQIVQTLVEITPEKVVLEVKNKVKGTGVAGPASQKVDVKAKVPKEEVELGNLPPGGKGSAKEIGRESVEAAGKTYDCRVVEFTGEASGTKSAGKVWRSDQIPGTVVKTEIRVEGGQQGEMAMKVVSVELK
jgi:hypothetical protein